MIRTLAIVPMLVLILYAGCFAQYFSESDTLSVLPVVGHPGDTIAVSVLLVNSFAMGGYQCRLVFDSLSFTPIEMNLGPRCPNFNLYGANFSESGVASLYATSWDPIDNAVLPGRGVIATVNYLILPATAPGWYSMAIQDSDSLAHENSISNCRGDSLVVPILVSGTVQVIPASQSIAGNSLPTEFGLAQNYPNPFNGATSISFSLENSQAVELSLFDLLGRKIATLYNGQAPAGDNTVLWESRLSGKEINSGLYFYRLISDQSGTLTKTMTLLK